MEKDEWVFIIWERSVLIDHQFVHLIGMRIKLFLECAAPRYPVLLLFLDVLYRHEGCIVKQSGEPVHHGLAELTRANTVLLVDLLVGEALRAKGHSGRVVEVLLAALMVLAHLELFFGHSEVFQAGPSERVHRHLSPPDITVPVLLVVD